MTCFRPPEGDLRPIGLPSEIAILPSELDAPPPAGPPAGLRWEVLGGAREVRPLCAPGGEEPRRRSKASAPPVAARALRGVVPPPAAAPPPAVAARAEGLPRPDSGG